MLEILQFAIQPRNRNTIFAPTDISLQLCESHIHGAYTTMPGSFTFSKYNDANGPLRRAIRLPAAVPF